MNLEGKARIIADVPVSVKQQALEVVEELKKTQSNISLTSLLIQLIQTEHNKLAKPKTKKK